MTNIFIPDFIGDVLSKLNITPEYFLELLENDNKESLSKFSVYDIETFIAINELWHIFGLSSYDWEDLRHHLKHIRFFNEVPTISPEDIVRSTEYDISDFSITITNKNAFIMMGKTFPTKLTILDVEQDNEVIRAILTKLEKLGGVEEVNRSETLQLFIRTQINSQKD